MKGRRAARSEDDGGVTPPLLAEVSASWRRSIPTGECRSLALGVSGAGASRRRSDSCPSQVEKKLERSFEKSGRRRASSLRRSTTARRCKSALDWTTFMSFSPLFNRSTGSEMNLSGFIARGQSIVRESRGLDEKASRVSNSPSPSIRIHSFPSPFLPPLALVSVLLESTFYAISFIFLCSRD